MYTLTMTVRENLDVRAQIGLLCVLAIWLHECPPAVSEFLSESTNLSYVSIFFTIPRPRCLILRSPFARQLIEQVKQSGINPLTQGLAAYVLGICFEYNEDVDSGVTRATLQPILLSRIGLDLFRSRLERLRESRPFNKVSPNMMV